MGKRFFLVLLIWFTGLSELKSQNMSYGVYQPPTVISGVYVVNRFIDGKDTLFTGVQGKVIDSLTRIPIQFATVELFSSRGDELSVKTDSTGHFKINALTNDCDIKLICTANASYKIKEWIFNTKGMPSFIQLKTVLELTKW